MTCEAPPHHVWHIILLEDLGGWFRVKVTADMISQVVVLCADPSDNWHKLVTDSNEEKFSEKTEEF